MTAIIATIIAIKPVVTIKSRIGVIIRIGAPIAIPITVPVSIPAGIKAIPITRIAVYTHQQEIRKLANKLVNQHRLHGRKHQELVQNQETYRLNRLRHTPDLPELRK